jgi:hypothetical protein
VSECKKCVQTYVKIILVETIAGVGRGIKESSGGGESKYDIFDTL